MRRMNFYRIIRRMMINLNTDQNLIVQYIKYTKDDEYQKEQYYFVRYRMALDPK